MVVFSLSPIEADVASEFIKRQNENSPCSEGAIGGRYTYQFTNTSLGTVASILDNVTGATKDLTDFASW